MATATHGEDGPQIEVPAGDAKKGGPPLVGVMGRHLALWKGFAYCAANKDSGIVWSPAHMFKYLVNHKKYIPGTKMFFAGIKKEKDRADLIAFLSEAAQARCLSSSSSFVVAWCPSIGFDK